MRDIRIFVEKKEGFNVEATSLKDTLNHNFNTNITNLRHLKVYDIFHIDEALLEKAKMTVFSEPVTDNIYEEVDLEGRLHFAVEFLPGQFDQRADSAAQCVQLISQEDRPLIRSAKVYALYGDISDAELEEIKKYVINPVEAREASLELPETLAMEYAVPEKVAVLDGFNDLSEEQLPFYYEDWYLPLVLAGESMPDWIPWQQMEKERET